MTEQEFLQKRKPVFVDPDSGLATIISNTNLKTLVNYINRL